MKVNEHDLEKVKTILEDAMFASDSPVVFLALKTEGTPQFEVKLVVPESFKIKQTVFLPSINAFVNAVCQSRKAALSGDLEEGLRNIALPLQVEVGSGLTRVKSTALCPITIEKEVQGLLFFAARENNSRALKIFESFAAQVCSYFAVREYLHIAHEANLKSQTMMETSQDAFFTIDTQGGGVHVSPNLEQMTGYPADEFLEGLKNPEKYVVPDDLQKFKEFYRQTFSGQKVSVEFQMKRKDGNIIWFSIFSNPIFDTMGRLVAIQGFGRDISENKKATWELQKTQEREMLKTEFMSVISHELRTPLTPIQGYTDLLLSGHPGELKQEQREALLVIKKQSKMLLALIDSVLDITRVEYGRPVEIKKEPIILNEIIDDVVDGLKFQFQEKEIKPETDLSQEIQTILADESKISRVISNVLGNALKFTPKKGHIGIKTAKIGPDVRVEIWDSGLGLEPNNLEKIFEKFFQVDSSYTRSVGGIGMGLTIVREIVEAHGGKVWAESNGLGSGTRIIFTLPLT
jgi:PAS domain S-box-containing protein